MASGTLEGGESYPSCLAGIKGEQLRSHPFRVKEFRIEAKAELRREVCVNCYN
jgi:hypothetical protein